MIRTLSSRWFMMLIAWAGLGIGPAFADAAEVAPPPMLLAQIDADDDPVPPPPRDRGPRDRGPRDVMRPLTDAQQQQVLAVLADINPEMKKRLDQALEDNPRRAQFVLRRAYDRHLKRLVKLREADREHYELQIAEHKQRIDVAKLVHRIRKATEEGNDEQVEALTAELRQKLQATFEVRQKLRRKELAQLERRIEAMRKELAEHEQQKDELIAEAMKKALKPRDRGHGADEAGPLASPRDRD